MKFIGDFHIHSHYSRATSKELNPEFLDYWASIKGIKVVGTGDFTHPGWLAELKEKLEPTEDGLFRLKDKFRISSQIKKGDREEVRFLLTAEISNIYKKNGKVRKVHNVVFAPGFEVAEKVQSRLSAMGFNITSDGRPILGLNSKKLLEICLECSDEIFFVPAHIWTPWFSVMGSKSGFDSVEECFEELSHHIFAVETGLSSDPPMNWLVSSLDNYTLIANSDAHSPEKLGRNANLFNAEFCYPSIIEAMKTGDPEKFLGTIDFFPEEGKYHFDGHRKCGIRWNPLETLQHNEICPVCGKPVTIGVLNRVAQLADRNETLARTNRHNFISLIPLKEILAEMEGVGPNSIKINQQYEFLIQKAASEFNILLHYDLSDIRQLGGEQLEEAIRRMRNREIYIKEGFDGEYGTVQVFRKGEKFNFLNQQALFKESDEHYSYSNKSRPLISFDIEAFRKLKKERSRKIYRPGGSFVPDLFTASNNYHDNLNPDQKNAMNHLLGPALVLAGPGTGKTKVLTTRIANLILHHGVNPEAILAVTFTNKAAGEMKKRIAHLLNNKKTSSKITVETFHAFGLRVLKDFINRTGREENFTIIDEDERKQILNGLIGKGMDLDNMANAITQFKRQLNRPEPTLVDPESLVYMQYEQYLKKINGFDIDDLITRVVYLFEDLPDMLIFYQDRYQWVLIDEYQDVNHAQYTLIKLLCPGNNPNLFAIGDPNQAIYGFRGADVQFIRKFQADYSNAMVYSLNTSYRCSDYILKASANIIPENVSFLKSIQKGVKIKIVENFTEKSEAEYIARTIEQHIGGVGFFSMDSSVVEEANGHSVESLSDFAILCRINKQMPAIEKALKDHNIPFQKIGDDSLLKMDRIKILIDLLLLSEKPDDRGLIEKLSKNKLLKINNLTEFIRGMQSKPIATKVEILIGQMFKNSRQVDMELDLVKEVALSVDNTSQLKRKLSFYQGIDSWNPGVEAVNLMTLHASKGLEFKCVVIPGCEQGLFPFSLFDNRITDQTEERRLLYVGMTRAKDYLYLTHSKKRYLMGKTFEFGRSEFLDAIEKEWIEFHEQEFVKTKENKESQLELF